jgi:outer membrane protein TolC
LHTQLIIEQSVYTGGRRSAQTLAAESERDAARMDLAAVQNELVFRVAEAYYRMIQSRELTEVRAEAVRQVESHLDIAQRRYEVGMTVKSDVLSVEVRLAEVREALITARNQFELTWAVLENVTGVRLPARVVPAQLPPAPWSEHVASLEQAISEALERRPEMAALASRQRAAQHAVRAAKAGDMPKVDLIGDYDVYTGGTSTGNDSFFVGLVIRLNLLDGYRTRREVEQACARLREIESRHDRLLLDVELSVRRAYLQLQDAQERLKVTGQAIEQAEESLREIEVRYRNQATTVTELIDAQVALSDARVRHTNARAELEIARAGLEHVAGRFSNTLAL